MSREWSYVGEAMRLRRVAEEALGALEQMQPLINRLTPKNNITVVALDCMCDDAIDALRVGLASLVERAHGIGGEA